MAQPLQYGLAGTQGYSRYYKHSGRVTFTGVVVAMLVGLPSAVLLGFVYAYADLYIPVVQLNALLTAGFGVAIGALCGAILRWGKVRNVPVTLTIIFVLTATAYYVSWVAWVCGVIDRFVDGGRDFTFLEAASNWPLMQDLIERINEVGTWTIGSSHSSSKSSNSNVSGTFLTMVWIAEAITIFWSAIYLGRKFAGDLPFCERCERWTAQPIILTILSIGDAGRLRAEMEAGRYGYAGSLKTGTPQDNRWWQIDRHRCMGCDQFNTITVSEVTRTIDKKGNPSLSKKVIVPKMTFSKEQLADLESELQLGQAMAHAEELRTPPT